MCRSDGSRERVRVRGGAGGALTMLVGASAREVRARLLRPDAADLPYDDANRAFTVSSTAINSTSLHLQLEN